VWDKSTRSDGTFSRADFVFDRERNVYICPGGSVLTSTGNIDQGHVYYLASKNDCSACSLKPKCTTAVARKVTRDLDEEVRDRVRALANTDAFHQSRRERKKVEMRFAHMKRIFKLDRLRLRGLSGAKDEVLLTATAQNLRRLVKFLCRPPPLPPVPCAA
jgi:Transposase DDE domain